MKKSQSRKAMFQELANIYLDLSIQDLQLSREAEQRGIDPAYFKELAEDRLRLSESYALQAKVEEDDAQLLAEGECRIHAKK